MTVVPIDAVEVYCDGCDDRMEYGGGEYTFWLREQLGDWLGQCEWREEGGKHYCCMQAASSDGATCWPPSMREAEAS